jgi:hypothetical protein
MRNTTKDINQTHCSEVLLCWRPERRKLLSWQQESSAQKDTDDQANPSKAQKGRHSSPLDSNHRCVLAGTFNCWRVLTRPA